jgi:hypothetical protein
MSPDDQAWAEQVERRATALKIAIDSNRKVNAALRLASMRLVDVAVKSATEEVESAGKPATEDHL